MTTMLICNEGKEDKKYHIAYQLNTASPVIPYCRMVGHLDVAVQVQADNAKVCAKCKKAAGIEDTIAAPTLAPVVSLPVGEHPAVVALRVLRDEADASTSDEAFWWQEKINAATTVLDIVLRDVLREDLGQTYTVGVSLAQQLPQRGAGHIQVRFGAAPENIESMTARVMQEIKKLQQTAPSEDLTNRAKESARRTYETSLKQNGYWLGRLQTITMLGGDPSEIVTRGQRIDAVTPQALQDVFKKYFPENRYTTVTLVPAKTAAQH